MPTWQVVLLGFLEGLTEFIPVSSTGHILLAGYFIGFDSPGKVFRGADPAGRDPGDPVRLYTPKLLKIALRRSRMTRGPAAS